MWREHAIGLLRVAHKCVHTPDGCGVDSLCRSAGIARPCEVPAIPWIALLPWLGKCFAQFHAPDRL